MLQAIAVSLAAAALAAPGLASTLEDTVIAYDTGNRLTWWCSDRDSFGAGVRFTPSEYPCEVVGARAEINYDDGQQIYLRIWDDDGPNHLPGTILYNEQRFDIPPNRTPGFRDYDLTSPVRIDTGDFYIVFWQRNVWDMLFSSDESLDSVSRQWWWFPDQGWVTPYGGNPGDHLIRAKVRYGTGIHEELGTGTSRRCTPTVVSGTLRLPDPPAGTQGALFTVSGRRVIEILPGDTDVRRLAGGVYFVVTEREVRKVVIER